jgi:hypothetical protein
MSKIHLAACIVLENKIEAYEGLHMYLTDHCLGPLLILEKKKKKAIVRAHKVASLGYPGTSTGYSSGQLGRH